MSHSHLAVRHLIRQLESRPRQRKSKPIQPEWLTQLLDNLSDRFEPFQGVARVGYECALHDGVWEISLFLGERESIGGSADGQQSAVNFQFNLLGIERAFDTLHAIDWNAFPGTLAWQENAADLSFLVLRGQKCGAEVCVRIQASASEEAGPGLRHHADGRVELT